MRSIRFPNMFTKTSTLTVDNYYATLQNLKMLLFSEKGELFGDPYYGTNLKKFLYDQNDYVLKDLVIDDIYTAIATFMPQIKVERRDITIKIEGNTVKAYIKAINQVDFQTNLYTIVLLDTVV